MNARALYDRCWQLIRARRFDHAVRAATQLCQRFPNNVEAWHALTVAARGNRDASMALEAINRATGLAPDNLEFKALKALCLLSAGHTSTAVELARSIDTDTTDNLYVLNTLAVVFQSTDAFDLQRRATARALALSPENAVACANHAEALRNVGAFTEALEHYNRLIELDSQYFSAYWGRSQCRKATARRNHVSELESLLATPGLPWRGEMQLCYALFKEREELELYDQAFASLSRGASLRRSNANYNVESDVHTMASIAEHFPAFPKQWNDGYEGETPIFVVGLPRSGTTLVERILGSHSSVLDAGEMQCFPVSLVKLLAEDNPGKHLDKLSSVAASTQMDWQNLGRFYIDSTRYRTRGAGRFTDKLPLNYLYLGLIARALPKARFVLLERDPMDSCFAMYKTLFAEAYPFTYSLNDLARYFIAWRQLMNHWIAVLGDRLVCVKYEALVGDTEATVRGLLSHCDLPWEDACLQSHSRRDGVSTASAAQVRQPIYQSSVNLWQRYENQLQPLLRQLQEAGVV